MLDNIIKSFVIESGSELEKLCKYKTDTGFYEIPTKSSDEWATRFCIYTFNKILRINNQFSKNKLNDILQQIRESFLNLILKNQEDGYEFVYRSFDYKIVNLKRDILIYFYFRMRKVPDKLELLDKDIPFNSFNLRKGESSVIEVDDV